VILDAFHDGVIWAAKVAARLRALGAGADVSTAVIRDFYQIHFCWDEGRVEPRHEPEVGGKAHCEICQDAGCPACEDGDVT
jgi:hypothetical protein